MKIESYSICAPVKGLCKSYGIWANYGSITGPLVYLRRPKWIKRDEDWERIVYSIRLELPQDIIIGEKED